MMLKLNFAVATDIVVFSVKNEELMVLLVKRGIAPQQSSWALPGGFVGPQESLDDAARRELGEETGVTDLYLEQLYSFGEADRDPRGRVVSVAYLALMRVGSQELVAGTDAAEAKWFAMSKLPRLAFDHADILKLARERLAKKVNYSSIALQLMPEEFTLAELQTVHETLTGRAADKRNFRKLIANQGTVVETGKMHQSGAHRPAALYRAKDRGVTYFD
jgi:8-oxo-dGTP diphosphatase